MRSFDPGLFLRLLSDRGLGLTHCSACRPTS